MKYFILILCFFTSTVSKSQDSTDTEMDKELSEWLKALPFCDSIKSWYYYWSYVTPDYSRSGNGENVFCRWEQPTKKEVLAIVKKLFGSSNEKNIKYVKIHTIAPYTKEYGRCPCQERKKAF